MDLKQIQDLIKFVSKSGVSEVQLEKKDFKITIKTEHLTSKEENNQSNLNSALVQALMQSQGQQQQAPQRIPQAPANVQQSTDVPDSQPKTGSEAKTPASDDAIDESKFHVIKAPMIGTFYRKPSPDKESFVKVGQEIQKGNVVCVIEAMKLFNEIESEVSGKIVKVLAEDSTPVEYDQALFLVEPS